MFKHILVPTDGSPLSNANVARAASFAREAGARVTLFYACPDVKPCEGPGAISSSHITPEIHDRLAEAAREIMDNAGETMHMAGVAFQCLVLVGNKPYELIIEAAESHACDLIFMASHGRHGVGALLLGSETQKVLTHSKIPVLIFR